MLWSVQDTINVDVPYGNLIEFGVYNGKCLEQIVKGFANRGKPFKEVWGFDSFQGLPNNAPEEGNPEWHAGSFNVCNDGVPGGFASIDEAMFFIRERVGRQDLKLIPGWFEDVLTKDLGECLKNTASYIHVDCDLGSSTKTALRWLFEYNIPVEGCLFRYDDFASLTTGQRDMHYLLSNKYNVNFDQIGYNVFTFRGYNA